MILYIVWSLWEFSHKPNSAREEGSFVFFCGWEGSTFLPEVLRMSRCWVKWMHQECVSSAIQALLLYLICMNLLLCQKCSINRVDFRHIWDSKLQKFLQQKTPIQAGKKVCKWCRPEKSEGLGCQHLVSNFVLKHLWRTFDSNKCSLHFVLQPAVTFCEGMQYQFSFFQQNKDQKKVSPVLLSFSFSSIFSSHFRPSDLSTFLLCFASLSV